MCFEYGVVPLLLYFFNNYKQQNISVDLKNLVYGEVKKNITAQKIKKKKCITRKVGKNGYKHSNIYYLSISLYNTNIDYSNKLIKIKPA